MAFCNNCGAPVPPAAKFCQACGTALAAPPAQPLRGMGLPPGAPGPYLPAPSRAEYPVVPTPADLPFVLQSDEVIYREIVPSNRLFWRLVLNGVLGSFALGAFLLLFLIPVALASAAFGGVWVIGGIFGAILGAVVLVSFIFAALAYPKFRYWITNHRTVGRRGVIGYSIDSIPLETISDVVVSRTIADRILHLASLFVQPFGGGSYGTQYGRGLGGMFSTGTNSFLGLEPEEVPTLQQMVFHLRDARRRETGRLI